MDQPVLSICIPTYNRSVYLQKSIESIVGQEEFLSGNVEIVISDNASTDDTEIMACRYTQKYKNVFYYKNKSNIRDRNFPLSLSLAHGKFRKLCNDTLLFREGALQKMVQVVRENILERPVIFFSNKNNGISHGESLEEFLYKASFNITWIGGFGVWEDFCNNIACNIGGCDELLWQVAFLLDYVNKKKQFVLMEERIFNAQQVQKKNISYGLYNVFYVNYLGFVKNFLNAGFISQACYDFCEKDLLFNFFPVWIYNWQRQSRLFEYSKEENLAECVMDACKHKPYYKEFKRFYMIFRIKMIVKERFRKILRLKR